jgi:protein-tyrosine phosphatase
MLLFVCHANICRSAMAERLARLALTGSRAAARITATSAGTHARSGDDMHPGAAEILTELGADPVGFRSRPLSADLIGSAGLVLTATREQRAFCVRLAPVALRRTFTIRQFGRLAEALATETPAAEPPAAETPAVETIAAEALPGGQLETLLRRVATVRGSLQPVEPDEDDLADPVNGSAEDIRACAHQIQLSLRPALALIGPG